ncbi:hypothetical protein BOX15_Mlig033926g4 [Macrostomum lignano]|uniref:RNA-directed DNA polymerase n=1 Tax=Macrostomum lignano TaxID=282301 RepID=A0A267G6R8_9PLAT|nr:hypothetical protein BOX15_Mlig033926g4 [Macrostomum lignano]
MASQASDLPLNDPAMTEAWLRSFAALSRSKKLTDSNEDRQITDLFLSKAGVEAVRRVSVMAQPKELENMDFADIRKLIMEKVAPKKRLVIAERSKFMALRQETGESTQQFAQRLRDASRFCEFSKLNAEGCHQTAEDELIQTMLISGLQNMQHRAKTLEFIQSAAAAVKLDTCVEYVQQLELIQQYSSSDQVKQSSTSSSTPAEQPAPAAIASVDKNRSAGKPCKFCGQKHPSGRCPAWGKTCAKCGRRNHFAAVCKSSSQNKSAHEIETEEPEGNLARNPVFTVSSTNKSKTSSIKNVKLDGKLLAMQLDSGSDASIIPKNFWKALGEPRLKRCPRQLRQFDGSVIKTLGCFLAVVELSDRVACIEVTVAACEKNHGLLGTDALDFKLDGVAINHAEVTPPLGKLRGFRARIVLKDNAQPSYFEARQVPIHMKPLVIEKLRKMVQSGILEPVPPGGSRWASPIVVVRKPNNDLRVCSDYKIGVNPKICADSYPLPNIESAFCALAGMTHFATVDLTNAYNQIELDENAREVLTINTPIGLLRWTRMPYGVKTASAQFQAAMEATIGDAVSNMVIYQDDICVGAPTEGELDAKVKHLLSTLKEAGMEINHEKCVFRSTEICFLGYRISADGVRPDKKLVEKIQKVKPPTTRKELESFLGLTNYYARYIQAYSEKIEPLTALRSQKSSFVWGLEQQKAFEDLKRALAVYPVIRIFDPRKLTTLTTDASESAVSGILSQDGHPVLYLSRRLSPAERNYSNIEREALAVVWATQRAKHFLLGKKFLLQCDHQPLEFIFGPSRELPKVTSARIMRWAIQLAAFDFDIAYVKGNSIPHVDAMSRMPFESNDDGDSSGDGGFIHWTETDLLRLEEIRQGTDIDPVLKSIKRRIQKNVWSNCSAAERPFKAVRYQLTIEDGVVCCGDLLVPPAAVRSKMLQAAHGVTHSGALATRNRLKREAWWPGHCNDVERFVKQCATCMRIRPLPNRTVHT